MKFRPVSILVALSILCPAVAQSSPVPDSEEWAEYLKSGESVVPLGIPTGKGAVSRFRGTDYSMNTGLQIVDPYNMSDESEILLSDAAKASNCVYASATMIDFLDETLGNAHTLFKRSEFILPVVELYYQPGVVSLDVFDDRTYKIGFGVYIKNGNSSEPAADVKILNSGIYRLPEKNKYTYRGKIYEAFMQNAPNFLPTSEKKTSNKKADLTAAILKSIPKNIINDLPDNRIKQSDIAKQIQEKKSQLGPLIETIITAENNRSRANINAQYKSISDEIDILKKMASNSMGNISEYIQSRMDIYDFSNNEEPLEVDLASTWMMIEAILFQNVDDIVEIRMPVSLKMALVDYAEREYLNQENADSDIIDLFETLWRPSNSGFDVVLACSERDRFLGCPTVSPNKPFEEHLEEIASSMLDTYDYVPISRMNEIVTLVVNAKPEHLNTWFNVDEYLNALQMVNMPSELKKYSDAAKWIKRVLEESYFCLEYDEPRFWKTKTSMDGRMGDDIYRFGMRKEKQKQSRALDVNIELPF